MLGNEFYQENLDHIWPFFLGFKEMLDEIDRFVTEQNSGFLK